MIKKIVCIVLSILLVVFIVSSMLLVNQKVDISSISKAEQIAYYTKPAVVRIIDGAQVGWKYETPDFTSYELDQVINNYLKKIGNISREIYEGSGAIISPNGYIVTNAHVVMISHLQDQQFIDREYETIKNELAKELGVPATDSSLMNELNNFIKSYIKPQGVKRFQYVILPGSNEWVNDEIKSYGAETGEGKDVAVVKIEGKNFPSLKIADSEKVTLEEDIWVCGYPAAADSEVLSKESILVSTINPGNVTVTDKKTTQGMPVLQVNAAASHGNSGGPVVDANGKIVGLLTFDSEQNVNESQGFNFVVPSNTVKEFMSQAGANNSEGQVDVLYKDGLKLYWGGYYKDALADFQSVQNIYPNHSETKKLIASCQEKSSSSKILWSKYRTLTIYVDIAAGIIVVILMFVAFYKDVRNAIYLKKVSKEIDSQN